MIEPKITKNNLEIIEDQENSKLTIQVNTNMGVKINEIEYNADNGDELERALALLKSLFSNVSIEQE